MEEDKGSAKKEPSEFLWLMIDARMYIRSFKRIGTCYIHAHICRTHAHTHMPHTRMNAHTHTHTYLIHMHITHSHYRVLCIYVHT